MSPLVHCLLSNAIAASGLAAIVWVITRIWRRPAVAHALWLLVLIKLVTPPLVQVPMVPESWLGEAPSSSHDPGRVSESERRGIDSSRGGGLSTVSFAGTRESLEEPPLEAERVAASTRFETGEPVPASVLPWSAALVEESSGHPPRPGLDQDHDSAPTSPRAESALPRDAQTSPSRAAGWRALLLGLWGAGSLLALGRIAWLAVRFGRSVLRSGAPVPPLLAEEVRRIAALAGLRRVPELLVVRGNLPPMLWGVGPATRLLLPFDLMSRLPARERTTLIAHELAHYARRDHWVRVLELLIVVAFWWHPVVHWSRRRLQDAEERLCDAWVVWALPGESRSYANAIVSTLDYLAERRFDLPPAACGVREVDSLRSRITMIMDSKTPRHLSRTGRLLLAALGLVVLPILPGVAQESSSKKSESQPPASQEPPPGILELEETEEPQVRPTKQEEPEAWQYREATAFDQLLAQFESLKLMPTVVRPEKDGKFWIHAVPSSEDGEVAFTDITGTLESAGFRVLKVQAQPDCWRFLLTPIQSDPDQPPPRLLRPGDMVRVVSRTHPEEVHGNYIVRRDGIIDCQLIGEVLTAGRSTRELGESLTRRFSDFLADAQVSVHLVEEAPEGSPEKSRRKVSRQRRRKLMPGDQLVTFSRSEPALNCTYIVRNDGFIDALMIGEIQAAGRTTSELGQQLRQTLGVYFQEPDITAHLTREAAPFLTNLAGDAASPGDEDRLRRLESLCDDLARQLQQVQAELRALRKKEPYSPGKFK